MGRILDSKKVKSAVASDVKGHRFSPGIASVLISQICPDFEGPNLIFFRKLDGFITNVLIFGEQI